MNKLYFQKRYLYVKNEILHLAFLVLSDSSFSKKTLKERSILKDFKNSMIRQSYCFLTSKQYSIFKRYRISRIEFRNNANLGLISGFRRSTW